MTDYLKSLRTKYDLDCRNLLLTVVAMLPPEYQDEDLKHPDVMGLMQLMVSIMADKAEKEDKT